MRRKSQIIILSLWILVILTLLTISVGQRVSMGLRLSDYQKRQLKALALAKAGSKIALTELEKDAAENKQGEVDFSDDNWANNQDIFKKITLGSNEKEFAQVSYIASEDTEKKAIFGIVDEERKININTATREILTALLEYFQITEVEKKVNHMLIWRGDISDTERVYETLGYPAKARPFVTKEELRLVKDLIEEDYAKLESFITVYGDSRAININTVTHQGLTIFVRGIAKELKAAQSSANRVANKLIELRKQKNGYFKNKDEIKLELTGDEEINIFNTLIEPNNSTLTSNIFFIASSGRVSKIKSEVALVYNRLSSKILYWHEY